MENIVPTLNEQRDNSWWSTQRTNNLYVYVKMLSKWCCVFKIFIVTERQYSVQYEISEIRHYKPKKNNWNTFRWEMYVMLFRWAYCSDCLKWNKKQKPRWKKNINISKYMHLPAVVLVLLLLVWEMAKGVREWIFNLPNASTFSISYVFMLSFAVGVFH